MKTLVWLVTAAALGIWSLVAWLAHLVIGAGGNALAANADWIPVGPELVETASWLAQFGTGIGEWLIVAIWAIVSLVILALGFVTTKLIPRFRGVS